MWTLFFVASCVVYPALSTTLYQVINKSHLHAKYGDIEDAKYPEDKYQSIQAEKFLNSLRQMDDNIPIMIDLIVIKLNLPEIKLVGVVVFDNLAIFTTSNLNFTHVGVVVPQKKININASVRNLYLDSDIHFSLELDDTFNATLTSDAHISASFTGNLDATLEFKSNGNQSGEGYLLDKVKVDLDFDYGHGHISIAYGLEEMRYKLAELLNNPWDLIADGLLKEIVKTVNRDLVKVPAKIINDFFTEPKTDIAPVSRGNFLRMRVPQYYW